MHDEVLELLGRVVFDAGKSLGQRCVHEADENVGCE